VDNLGHALTEDLDPPTGTVILQSYETSTLPAGRASSTDTDLIVYHYIPLDEFGGPSFLGINFLCRKTVF
jgi:arabinan endo-1,5-alpha-L-arabinosidase